MITGIFFPFHPKKKSWKTFMIGKYVEKRIKSSGLLEERE